MGRPNLRKRLGNTSLARCKYWAVCSRDDCYHHEPHSPGRKTCQFENPVKYCRAARGFVCDVPLSEMDSNYECDPNLAFKAKIDADKREGIQERTARHHSEWLHSSHHTVNSSEFYGEEEDDDDE
jgi:hypothetical protein